jgi:hypothetical protein
MSKNITKYTKEVLEAAVKVNTTVAGVVRSLGHTNGNGGMNNYISMRINMYGIDRSHFTGRSDSPKFAKKFQPLTWQEMLVFDSNATARRQAYLLRRALVEYGVPFKCAKCNTEPTWQGEDLVLEVDHINGQWRDNRPENLRFLCPNCHSQTPTFRSLNARGAPISAPVQTTKRSQTARKTKINWPSFEELVELLDHEPLVQVAKRLGVSDTALKWKCVKLGVPRKPMGFWTRKNK